LYTDWYGKRVRLTNTANPSNIIHRSSEACDHRGILSLQAFELQWMIILEGFEAQGHRRNPVHNLKHPHTPSKSGSVFHLIFRGSAIDEHQIIRAAEAK
jgi:hypothetical protein